MATTLSDTSASRLEVRNRRFATEGGEVPRHWHGGRRSVTSFLDNLSLFFPAGEAFFVEAVKAHKHLVTDARLREDVIRFCAQEGIHAREHTRYNAMLEGQGYPAAELERRIERILQRVRRRSPRRIRLSVTCALEHFTAVMARELLEDARLLEGAHPVMSELWRWHALEEHEHRAVAFDVYRLTKPTYVERTSVMLATTAIFWFLVVEHQVRMMRVDGTDRSPEEWRALVRFLFVEPGGMRTMWRRWLDYFHPRFHPRRST